jgi:hypothetical protein
VALEEIAKVQDGGQAACGADDIPVLCSSRIWSDKNKNKEREDDGSSFHNCNPEGFSRN